MIKPPSTSSGSETKASKSPTHWAAKKPPVQAVQCVQTVQAVKCFEGSENLQIRTFSSGKIVEDLEAALEQFREIAVDLGGEATKETTSASISE